MILLFEFMKREQQNHQFYIRNSMIFNDNPQIPYRILIFSRKKRKIAPQDPQRAPKRPPRATENRKGHFTNAPKTSLEGTQKKR